MEMGTSNNRARGLRADTDVPLIAEQGDIQLEEQFLIEDPELEKALAVILKRALSGEDVDAARVLRKVPVTKQRARQASRTELSDRTTARAAAEIRKRNLNPMGHELDTKRLGKSNLVVVAAAISAACNEHTGHRVNECHEFTQDELNGIRDNFEAIVAAATAPSDHGADLRIRTPGIDGDQRSDRVIDLITAAPS